MNILTLCTGNAARSVMLGYMLESLAATNHLTWSVRTAGTHTAEGQAMSPRTFAALRGINALRELPLTSHRSHQLTVDDVRWADVILAAEADHVTLCRHHYPESRERVVQVVTMARVARGDLSLAALIGAVASLEPLATDDVADPAGGDQADYDRCADHLWSLAQAFADVVIADRRP